MHGSGGYIVEQYPIPTIAAAVLLLYVVWLVLKR